MMKIHNVLTTVLLLISLCSFSQPIQPQGVKEIMKRVADWQMEHIVDVSNRMGTSPYHPLDWTNATLYVGMVKWANMSDDDKYYEWLKNVGEKHQWQLHRRKYHADDHCVGQMYCELHQKYGDKSMIEPTINQFDFIISHPAQGSMEWKSSPYHQDRWNWCDALFMSPAVLAKLYKITGDKKYLDFMLSEYKVTTDYLFDKKEGLYFRDGSYIAKRENGIKIFWSRGNGWVFAGLANILDELDPKTKKYRYFVNIFKKMAKKLAEIQTPEGHWAMSLLGQEFYPTPETSGSSFFTFGLAWGVNKGILDYKTYEPAVRKGWAALVNHVTPEGMLGYVQHIGGGPGKAYKNNTDVYGVGAFLCAGSEVYKLYNSMEK